MKRWVPLVVVALFLSLPVPAQAELRVPEPLPLAPETGTFYIFGSRPVGTDQTNGCPNAIAAAYRTASSQARLFASNNPNDPCQAVEGLDPSPFTAQPTSLDAAFRVHMLPRLPAGVPLVTGKEIVVRFTLVVYSASQYTDVSFGWIKPNVTLGTNLVEVAHWDEAPPLGAESFRGPEQGTTYRYDYTLNFTAPATLPEGVLNLTVDLSNKASKEHQELRRTASRVGFAIDPAKRGEIRLPIAEGARALFEDPDEGPEPTESPAPENITDTPPVKETPPENVSTPPDEDPAEPNATKPPATTEDTPAVGLPAAILALAFLVARGRRRP